MVTLLYNLSNPKIPMIQKKLVQTSYYKLFFYINYVNYNIKMELKIPIYSQF